MPASKPASSPSTPPGSRPCGRLPSLRADTRGVSEVISQILVFAIVTAVFLLSMVAFQAAQEATRDRVVEVRAQSAASRVASAVVQAGILTEQQDTAIRVRFHIDLPPDLDGLAYQVSLLAPAGESATILVEVPSRGIQATAPLFSIEAAAGVKVCPTTVDGGSLYARFADTAPGTPTEPCIFLEALT